ncbi:hypothetical protein MXM82_01640 [Pseudomonas asiatica]|uniref:hypothetical protein n=1 Tax=Pseudomonas asiatica TaxID=2219225 RepID=UPI002DB7D4A5|nr:hypothetical protein [Pseudomonas asiatica]MEB6587842.1 hypothetical protein [Pseudomonas asiatica]
MVGSDVLVAEFVTRSGAYKKTLSEVVEASGAEIETEYSEVLVRLDSAKILRAKLHGEELIGILAANGEDIKKYSVKKIYAFSDNEDDDQEYSAGREPRGDEKSKTLAVGKYSRGFLLTNIIEYTLARAGRERLLEYVKLCRIPQAAKYTDQIMKLISDN